MGLDVTAAEIDRVRQIMTDTGAVEYAKSKAADHVQKAQEALKLVKTTDNEAIGLLSDLADILANRDH